MTSDRQYSLSMVTATTLMPVLSFCVFLAMGSGCGRTDDAHKTFFANRQIRIEEHSYGTPSDNYCISDGPTLGKDHMADIGRRLADESKNVKLDFRLANSESRPVSIVSIVSSCGCTAATVDAMRVLPGTCTMLHVNLDLSHKRGLFDATVGLVMDNGQMARYTTRCEIIKRLTCEPQEISFGAVGPSDERASHLLLRCYARGTAPPVPRLSLCDDFGRLRLEDLNADDVQIEGQWQVRTSTAELRLLGARSAEDAGPARGKIEVSVDGSDTNGTAVWQA